jgi:hypothetical protein
MTDPAKDPAEMLRNLFWSPLMALAPNSLTQPINQGWSFGSISITTNNSRAPGVERCRRWWRRCRASCAMRRG